MNTFSNENEHPDHTQLKKLLEQAKPLMLPMASIRFLSTATSSGSSRVKGLMHRAERRIISSRAR
jgi:hypothetical protein